MTKDYYKILGVTEFESAENIKIAYRKLARKWHPDIAGNSLDVMSKFKEINEAYSILSNQVKKAEYDKARRFYNYAKDNKYNYENTEKKSTESKKQNKNFKFNWEEFLGKKYRETLFQEQKIKAAKNGEIINTDLDITVFESISGTTKTINILQTEICPKCKGKKFVNTNLCDECKGKGEKNTYKRFTVKIPAGIKNGSKIRLAGEGGKGIHGGCNGDLFITIHIKEENNYKTEGLNIFKTIPITPFEAVLGGNIKVESINGSFNIKIAPNTQNGQKIRVSGAGIVQNNKIGDMIITVEIRIPKKLTEEEIGLYKKLAEISSSNIRDVLS